MATIDVNDVVQLTHTAAQVDADIDGSVRADIGQSFSATQQAQARTNIGVKSNNPNLLDNWYWGSGVINQRGQTSYSNPSTKSYFVDRFSTRNSACTITLESDGITITNTGSSSLYVEQYLENPTDGGIVTASLDVASYTGTIYMQLVTPSAQYGTSLRISTVGINKITDTRELPINRMFILINAGSSIKIKALKLEYGSTSTLADSAPPDRALELFKCLRFYQRIAGNSSLIATGLCFSTTTAQMQMPLFAPMRANGTVTLHGTAYLVGGAFIGSNGKTFTDANITYRNAIFGTNSAEVQVGSLSGLTVGQCVQIQLRDATSYFDISADL